MCLQWYVCACVWADMCGICACVYTGLHMHVQGSRCPPQQLFVSLTEGECFTKPRIRGFSYSSQPALAKEPVLGYSGAAVAACLSVRVVQSGCLIFYVE